MSKEIITISVPKGELESDYTFYEDGKIHHIYDQSVHKLNLEAWITARNLSDSEKEKILKVCPYEHKAKIAAILKKK